ncbi:MAG: sugar transferase [bacterium]
MALASLTFLSLIFWYRFFSFSRMVMLMNGVALVILSAVCRTLVLKGAAYYRRKGLDLANALVITSGNSEGITRKILQSQPELGYKLKSCVTSSDIGCKQAPNGSTLFSIFDRFQVEDLFLDLASDGGEEAAEFIDQCQREPVRIHFAHRLYRDIRPHPRWRVVDEGEWYTLERTAWDRLSQALKRGMDIAISVFVLTLFSPVMALITAGIRLTSKGPIVFHQERAGLNGRPFTIYKFRSMVEEAERQLDEIVDVQHLTQPVFKLENDPRVTPLGRWLRRFSLDELPQFWNVLRGEMSVVGPRPEELWVVDRYDDATRARLRIKPGITGYQQILSRGSQNMTIRLNHDLYYMDHQSLFFDTYIILQTLWVVLSGKGRI